MKCSQLTAADRKVIEVLLRRDCTQKEISKELGVHPSTISREIKRNGGRKQYIAKLAQVNYEARRYRTRKLPKIRAIATKDYILDKLQKGWSPEQIAGRMRLEDREDRVCHETIYTFIYSYTGATKRKWYSYLRYGRKQRKKQNGRSKHRSKIPNRVSIHERPPVVKHRSEYGHWEGDSVIYPNRYTIHTMNELKTGIVSFRKLRSKSAKLTAEAMTDITQEYGALTITVDNGSEFTNHQAVTKNTGVPVYFCDPYSSWQRGSNENSNMLLRGFLPKRHNISKLSQEELDLIAAELNNRPRKRLGYRTPNEVYLDEIHLSNLKEEKVAFQVRI